MLLRKITLIICFLAGFHLAKTQHITTETALSLVGKNKEKLGLSEYDMSQVVVTDAYRSNVSGLDLIYLQQTHKGIPVFNQIQSLAFKNGTLISVAGTRHAELENKTRDLQVFPSIHPEQAARIAIASKKLTPLGALIPTTIIPGRKLDFGKAGIASTNITAELMWVVCEDGTIKLAWQIYLVPISTSDYWMIRIDAHNGKPISENNLTVYCNWGDNNTHSHQKDFGVSLKNINAKTKRKPLFEDENKIENALLANSPAIINGASYRVIPFPAESPRHAGGNPVLVNNPWSFAPGNATSLKWHSNGSSDFIYTRGNNVWAQEDSDGNNGTGVPTNSTSTADPLSFNFIPDFTLSPSVTSPAPNQQFNVTNLFYWNNVIHDVMYQYGFDEVAGNFQVSNQGRGGNGNDAVFADAQDGSGTNNANFSTPADGGSGRMQMYLWNATPTLTVNTPSTIAGQYQAVESNFSTANKIASVGPRTGQVVYYNDQAAGTTHEGCIGQPTNVVLGKIALIDRGNCNFTVKVKNAQTAGAIAVIMINNVQGAPITMGGTDNTITIPAIMISINDGPTFINQLSNNLNVTIGIGPNLDGDVDNGVVVHEFSHGTSNRLTGGPSQASCLGNAEQMGEGWSDYYALMLTQDWAGSTLNSGELSPRGIGTYVVGQTPIQGGIRTQKYCTDLDINNKVYAATIPATVHDLGEIWCATLWDMTWNIIKQTGTITSSIYNSDANAGNAIALKLVTEGMKLQPCSPGFIDGRNAILKADSILYNGAYRCAIKEAFRRRGMGEKASQGSSGSVTDQVADYTPYVTIEKRTNKITAQVSEQIEFTTLVTSCSPVTNYIIRDTLPVNVTYITGGSYNSANRVVSFNVNFDAGATQSYSYIVQVNPGSYFTPQTLFEEQVTGSTIPTSLSSVSTTQANWTVSSVQSSSSPNAFFTPNTSVLSDQKLETVASYPLGTGTSALTFNHRYQSQDGVDGAVLEISTDNGSTWKDAEHLLTKGYYNQNLSTIAGHPLSARKAWSGNASQFIYSSVNLSSFSNQSIKFRFRFGSNASVASTGWFVDDIKLERAPVVNIRSTLFDDGNIKLSYSDTVTKIIDANTCVPVNITQSPQYTSQCAGDSARFTAVATGSNPQYTWQVSINGGSTFNNIPNSNANAYTIAQTQSAQNNNRYRIIVNNNCPSSDTSDIAILEIKEPVAVSQQPSDATICLGSAASFVVQATGDITSQQWELSTDGGNTFTPIAGANSSSLSIPNVTLQQNGNIYRLAISGCRPNTVYSNAVTLTVSNQTSILSQPADASGCVGGTITIQVSASGSNLNFQWQVSTDGGLSYNNIAGASSNALTLNNLSFAQNQNRYRVEIQNDCGGSVNSNPSVLTVRTPASFSLQPVNVRVCDSTTAAFSVAISGADYTIQWQESTDGGATYRDIPSSNSTTLVLNPVNLTMDGMKYRARLRSCDTASIYSNEVTLNVIEPARIRSISLNHSVCVGDTISFSVQATGNNLTYQWEMSTDGGLTFTSITGANAATLQINNVLSSMNQYQYRAKVSNECTSGVLSPALVLTITEEARITEQPQQQNACPGSDISFQVLTSGSVTGYQWQISTDGGITYNAINGATSDVLNLNGVSTSDNGNLYRVAIFTTCSNLPLFSNASSLSILPTSQIIGLPVAFMGCPGETAIFGALISGNQPSYQWQESNNGGVSFSNINGANSDTLRLPAINDGMNNNLYRLSITDQPCGIVTNPVSLSIKPTAVVRLTASPYQNLLPGLTTTLTATSLPASDSFFWYKNGILIPDVTGQTYLVRFDQTGSYAAKSRNSCEHQAASINIGDSVVNAIMIYPNPTEGKFMVRFNNQKDQKVWLTLFDSKGSRIINQFYPVSRGFVSIDGNIRKCASGVYAWSLLDENGEEMGSGKLIKQ
jgi:uncharacterized repeat protein (TIGR01451 family)